MCKIWFCDYRWLLRHKDFPIWRSIMGWIIENFRRIGLNGVATNFNRRIFSWRPEQPLLFRSFLQKFICVDLTILTRLHTHTLCMFYFITDGYQNSIFCNTALIPSRDYEKSHQLKQRSVKGQPSLRTAVSQACPSGRIQGWYGRRSVATYV